MDGIIVLAIVFLSAFATSLIFEMLALFVVTAYADWNRRRWL